MSVESMKKVYKEVKTVTDIRKLQVKEAFIDDHLNCVVVSINDVLFEFFWYDSVGFIEYYKDSIEAFKDLKNAMLTSIRIEEDS